MSELIGASDTGETRIVRHASGALRRCSPRSINELAVIEHAKPLRQVGKLKLRGGDRPIHVPSAHLEIGRRVGGMELGATTLRREPAAVDQHEFLDLSGTVAGKFDPPDGPAMVRVEFAPHFAASPSCVFRYKDHSLATLVVALDHELPLGGEMRRKGPPGGGPQP